MLNLAVIKVIMSLFYGKPKWSHFRGKIPMVYTKDVTERRKQRNERKKQYVQKRLSYQKNVGVNASFRTGMRTIKCGLMPQVYPCRIATRKEVLSLVKLLEWTGKEKLWT